MAVTKAVHQLAYAGVLLTLIDTNIAFPAVK